MSAGEKGRSEVAAELRRCGLDSLNGMSFQRRLAEIVGVPGGTWRQVMMRLAALVDRLTCEMEQVGDPGDESYRCSRCQNSLDMPDFDEYPYGYCPYCGAEVVPCK